MSVAKSQELRVKSQKRAFALRSWSGPRPSSLDPRPAPRGITLVELLITILIISILAGLILGVAAVAGETARESHTRHVVARLHTLLMERYDTYKTRRVRLNPDVERQINNRNWPSPTNSYRGRALAEARLYALREMVLMEVPDRWSDVLLVDIGNFNPSNVVKPLYLNERTDLSNVYLRRCVSLLSRINDISGAINTADEIRRNQGAECLYMVITLATGDGEARSQFGENSIGDVDGDGAPEFLDGWGHPINFLRWAPGFDSLVQINANVLSGTPPVVPRDNPDWETAASGDHDPFDIFRLDPAAFRLVPLIYSPGRDEDSGLISVPEFVTWRITPTGTPTYSNTQPLVRPELTPYKKGGPAWPDDYLGTDEGNDTSTDNVHNHLIGLR